MKIFSYMKKHIPIIIVIVGLVVVQALCDLALPTYTSNIINVGVQEKGIDESIPEVIRKTEFDKLLLLLTDENIDIIKDNFLLVSKDDKESVEKYSKEYPIIKKEDIMLLNIKNSKQEDKISSIMTNSMLVLLAIENPELSMMPGNMNANLPEGVDIFTALQMMTPDAKNEFLEQMNSKLNDIPDMIKGGASISYISKEYETIGMDVDKIQTNYIMITGAKMIGIALISMITTVFVGLFGSRVAASFAKDVRNDLYKKTLSFSTGEMKEFGTSSLITRTTNDITQVQTLIVMVIRTVVYSPVIAIGAIIKVMNSNASMTWIIALAVAVILSVIIMMFSLAVPRFKKMQTLVDKLNLVTREIITGIPVIRAFANQKHEEKRFDKANKNLTNNSLFVQRLMSGMMPMMMLVMNGVTLLIVWNGAKGIDTGTMQLGDMIAFIQYAMQIIMAFLMISMISIILPRAIVSSKRINEVLVKKVSIKDPKKPKKFIESKRGIVEFKDVYFKYPDADENVLSNITFTAKKGQTTAFIGSTGSGKSTIINLIPRLFDRTSGTIKVNGVDIKEVSQHDLHDVIGYIPQKGVLFSGDIESNIKYGSKEISDEQMIKAASIAQAKEFIEAKEDKYQSNISQGGTNVSGGQKQRLSIARAIAKNPDIYIFDDSFSALDFKTDALLRQALAKNTKDATILIVAQRINTIMNADQIIVLEEGKIVGIGKHKQLLKTCKVYKEIASSQLTKEELENE